MNNNNNNKPTYVVKGTDGIYRWTYRVGSGNRSLLKTYMLIFALVILIPGLILFFMIFGSDIRGRYWTNVSKYLLIFAAVFLGVQALTVLIYKAVEKARGGSNPIPYSMNDDMIMLHADISQINRMHYGAVPYVRTDFLNVTGISPKPESDLILLHEPLRVTHVYVPKEDYDFVLNFIRDRVPNK